ncbi:MAG: chemotaxis protein CheW [Gemmatimonadaceae bacterium]
MTTTAATRRQLVTFETATELFAVDIAMVERVLRYAVPRQLPNTASWLRGVIAPGDRLVPVLDLRERLALGGVTDADRARILLVGFEDGPVGIVVDAVHEVLTVESGAIETPPSVYRGLAREFVQGIVRRDERLFVLLDLGRLVTSTERIAMRKAVAAEGADGG